MSRSQELDPELLDIAYDDSSIPDRNQDSDVDETYGQKPGKSKKRGPYVRYQSPKVAAQAQTAVAANDGSRKRVYFLKNGLVSLKIPKNLQQTAARNSTESILLALPVEIRTNIFKYALGWGQKHRLDYRNQQNGTFIWKSNREPLQPFTLKVPAVQLTRVCRQIYSETATMVYDAMTFSFIYSGAFSTWTERRIPAQRDAIRALELDYVTWKQFRRGGTLFTNSGVLLGGRPKMPKLRDIFPNLETLKVIGRGRSTRSTSRGPLAQQYRDEIIQREAPDADDEGLDVLFEDL